MLDFTQNNSVVTYDNTVVIGGLKYQLSDAETLKVKSILDGMVSSRNTVSSPVSTTLHIEEPTTKKATFKDPVGNKVYQDDFTTVTEVDGTYRLYMSVPMKGEKGDKVRYAIKASAKNDFDAKWGGDYDNNDIYWVFPNKTKAQSFIKARKDYNKKSSK